MKFPYSLLTAALIAAIPSHANDAVQVTGKYRVVNGTADVPAGLFGVHATKLTPETAAEWGVESVRTIDQKPKGIPLLPGANDELPLGVTSIVECFFDRYQPALLLTDPDWKKKLETLAITYAKNAQTTGFPHAIEFWNEPFLNWASKPGVNYDGTFYEPGNEGTPMTIKGQSKPLDSLIWSKQLVAVDPATGRVNHLASSYAIPFIWKNELKEGDEYIFREKLTLRIVSRPWGKDPSQSSFYSARQNSEFYRTMIVPFAKTLKEANPKVQLIGGWGFHISQDNWGAWPVLFKPLIDESIQWLDAISEHHYGGDTRRVPGSYEVLAAYAQTEHGKQLKFYNTEAGGALDPERPDAPAAPNFQANTGQALLGAFTYMVRDVIHIIDICPDKAIARASHTANANGDRFALKFMKEMRGRLLAVESGVTNVWTVGAMQDKQICVIAYNDNKETKTFLLQVTAPAGWKVVKGRVEKPERIENLIEFKAADIAIKKDSYEETIELPAKSAMKWIFECEKREMAGEFSSEQRFETQHFARGIINRLSSTKPVSLEIKIPEAALKSATAAQLKIVQENWNADCVCLLNGKELKLDVRNSWTHVQAIDPALLQSVNTLVFKTSSDKEATIGMASIATVATQPER